MRVIHASFSPSGGGETVHSRAWPWAAGSLAAVVLVLGAALLGHAIVSSQHAPPLTVSAPALPPLVVSAATPVSRSAQLVALDASAGHLVALTTSGEPVCPPNAACPPAAPLQSFTIFDGQSGAVLAATPLTGPAAPAAGSVLLLADTERHLAYAIAPRSVDIFSTETGQRVGGYPLPSIPWVRESGGVFDPAHNELLLAGGGWLESLDAATGQPIAVWRATADTARMDGPVLDETSGVVYLLAQPTTGKPALVALDAATLALKGQAALPAGSYLGPLDTAANTLYIFGKSGMPCRYTVSMAGGLALAPAPNTTAGCDATAVGWNAGLGHIYGAERSGIVARDAGTGQLVAALLVRVAWAASVPLLVDSTRDLVYLPDAHGTILIARDGAQTGALTVGTAGILARAALARFLPDTNQDPPFVAPESFPAAVGTLTQDFWIHYADIGWRGPYAGTAQTAVSAAPGHAGGYVVTFALSWNQVYQHHHSWVCLVAPDGSVLLRSASGDTVP